MADFRLELLAFADLPGFSQDDHGAALAAFLAGARAPDDAPLRAALPASQALAQARRRAGAERAKDADGARRFFEREFRPFRVRPQGGAATGFFTGYYEPEVEASPVETTHFRAPILGLAAGVRARSMPERSAIEAGAMGRSAPPLLWLRDPAEVFFVQVQGSARAVLPDGRRLRLVYAGRNGWPYASIGRILIETGAIAEDRMSLAALKAWIRAQGQEPGGAGRELMARNRSYVFFSAHPDTNAGVGPVGGAGVELTPLRSLAVDRARYAYSTPVWIDVAGPPSCGRLRRLMIAQDTGSAIVGAARADIFFGSGDEAGACAGDMRHAGDFVILLPVEDCAAA